MKLLQTQISAGSAVCNPAKSVYIRKKKCCYYDQRTRRDSLVDTFRNRRLKERTTTNIWIYNMSDVFVHCAADNGLQQNLKVPVTMVNMIEMLKKAYYKAHVRRNKRNTHWGGSLSLSVRSLRKKKKKPLLIQC